MSSSSLPCLRSLEFGSLTALGKSVDKYKLHSREEEDSKNIASKGVVIKVVLLIQLMQATFSTVLMLLTAPVEMKGSSSSASTAISINQSWAWCLMRLAWQFFVAMMVMDIWQYGWHRYMHINRFLYRHIHSWHHRLVVPYPYGTFYVHPIDGLLLDTVGSLLSVVVSGMSPRVSMFFFCIGTMKAVDDHCGVMLPWNLFHRFFWNNTAFHDVHHQLRGTRFNFSQPFFITWDKVFGTYMPYVLEKRPDGSLEAHLVMEKVRNGKET